MPRIGERGGQTYAFDEALSFLRREDVGLQRKAVDVHENAGEILRRRHPPAVRVHAVDVVCVRVFAGLAVVLHLVGKAVGERTPLQLTDMPVAVLVSESERGRGGIFSMPKCYGSRLRLSRVPLSRKRPAAVTDRCNRPPAGRPAARTSSGSA